MLLSNLLSNIKNFPNNHPQLWKASVILATGGLGLFFYAGKALYNHWKQYRSKSTVTTSSLQNKSLTNIRPMQTAAISSSPATPLTMTNAVLATAKNITTSSTARIARDVEIPLTPNSIAMVNNTIYNPDNAQQRNLSDPGFTFRRNVFVDTIRRLNDDHIYQALRECARKNFLAWQSQQSTHQMTVSVFNEDWGTVARRLTQQYGAIFTVLNSTRLTSTYFTPEDNIASEMQYNRTSMLARTDCYRFVTKDFMVMQPGGHCYEYTPLYRELSNAGLGEMKPYLDNKDYRICVRGPEVINEDGSIGGYNMLGESDIFPFYELRYAARPNIRDDNDGVIRAVAYQLDALIKNNIRHVLFFEDCCENGLSTKFDLTLAMTYKNEIAKRASHFEVIAFVITQPSKLARFQSAFTETPTEPSAATVARPKLGTR